MAGRGDISCLARRRCGGGGGCSGRQLRTTSCARGRRSAGRRAPRSGGRRGSAELAAVITHGRRRQMEGSARAGRARARRARWPWAPRVRPRRTSAGGSAVEARRDAMDFLVVETEAALSECRALGGHFVGRPRVLRVPLRCGLARRQRWVIDPRRVAPGLGALRRDPPPGPIRVVVRDHASCPGTSASPSGSGPWRPEREESILRIRPLRHPAHQLTAASELL